MSQVVGLFVLANNGRPGNSRTRTDYILPSYLVRGSFKSTYQVLQGPWTAENTAGEGGEGQGIVENSRKYVQIGEKGG